MTNLGLLHFFLGIQVLQMDDGILLSQPKCIESITYVQNEYCKPWATPYHLGVNLTKV